MRPGVEAPREGPTQGRKPRIASERADIDHLVRALGILCDQIQEGITDLQAIAKARLAVGRVLKNREERDRRTKA